MCLERTRGIGFRYVDITRAVVVHHGSRDTRVPVDNVRWLAGLMKRCEVRVLEGEGHGLMASATVMGGVLTEMAQVERSGSKVVSKGGRRTGNFVAEMTFTGISMGALLATFGFRYDLYKA